MSIDIRYIAGFFDAEGYVGVKCSKGGYHSLQATLTNNHQGVLVEIQKLFGGSLIEPKLYGLKKGKEAWVLSFHAKKAVLFLEAICPYLVVKKNQTELASSYPLNENRDPVEGEIREARQTIMDELKRMKSEYKSIPDEWQSTRRILEDDPDVQKAVELYTGGMGTGEVAEVIGKKISTISYWLRTLGVNRSRQEAGERAGLKRKDRVTGNPAAQDAAKLFDQGLSISEITDQLGQKYGTVYYWLKQLGRHRTLEEAQQIRRQREAEQNPPRPPRPPKIPLADRDDVKRAIKLRQSKELSYEKIAEIISQEFGKKYTYSHIGYWFQQLGLSRNPETDEGELKEITRLYIEKEKSLRQVAKAVGRSLSFVQRRIRDAGLTRSPKDANRLKFENNKE